MGDPIAFFAAGIPQSKGSMRAFYIEKLGRAVLTDSNKKAKTWQGVISTAAMEAGMATVVGPVAIDMVFMVHRPKGHYGTGRNEGKLKAWAHDRLPDKKPDVDKLARCVLDALTGISYVDDARVTKIQARKRWAGWGGWKTAGVWVCVERDR